MSNFTFSASDFPDTMEGGGTYKELAPGEYLAEIIDTDMSPTKAGTGEKLTLQFEVIEGDCAGTYIWHNLNIENPSQQAVEISKRQLAQICRAVGMEGFQQHGELFAKRCVIVVAMGKANNDYPSKPEIRGWKPAIQPQPAAQSQPARSRDRPWD
jgi:hypothetical protein